MHIFGKKNMTRKLGLWSILLRIYFKIKSKILEINSKNIFIKNIFYTYEILMTRKINLLNFEVFFFRNNHSQYMEGSSKYFGTLVSTRRVSKTQLYSMIQLVLDWIGSWQKIFYHKQVGLY